MIKVIEIENIKGIQNKQFNLSITPNRPSLLVAPNGFGKSSLAIAFNSMNNRRIILTDENCYEENTAHIPRISIEYLKLDGTESHLEATNTTNTISGEIDCFVINNLMKPKGNASNFGGFANAKATIVIEDIVLVDRIPANISFNYSFQASQVKFGVNAKVLPNVNVVLSNLAVIEKLSSCYQALQRANGHRIQEKINNIIAEINGRQGTAQVLNDWITTNRLDHLKQIEYLNIIGNVINEFDVGYNSETKSFLAAIQIIWLYNSNTETFKNACNFSIYKLDRLQFDTTLSTFNNTWKNIRSSENDNRLLVKFPKTVNISNGQRDILTFIAMLFKAKRNLKKLENILIIDEVFDYLDDANLTAAQYYITTFIKEYVRLGKRIYPLILTHLNPNYFKNFAFSNQKVYYLDKTAIQVNQGLTRLLRNRENVTIKDDIDKYLLHYYPGTISKRAEFRALTIPELWGEGNNFIQYLNNEVTNYLAGNPFDPFAICGAVRVKVEEIAYNKLQSNDARNTFLATHTTRKKLEKAEEMGIVSPESHYLLGIIYNEGMHWRENQDNVSPIASKLENLTIKKLISDVFN